MDLPALAQWLLLAAFLASRNSHASDRLPVRRRPAITAQGLVRRHSTV